MTALFRTLAVIAFGASLPAAVAVDWPGPIVEGAALGLCFQALAVALWAGSIITEKP